MAEKNREVPRKVDEPTRDQFEIDKRIESAREWVIAARNVATVTQDPEALRLVRFLEHRTHLGVPLPDGGSQTFFIGEPPIEPDDYYAYLVPLLESDKNLLPPGDERQDLFDQFPSRYIENSHMLYLSPTSYHPTTKGLIILHELKHATTDIVDKPDREAPDQHWREEAEAYKLECRLLEGMSGEPYRELIRQSVDCIEASNDNPKAISWDYSSTQEAFAACVGELGLTHEEDIAIIRTLRQFDAFWHYAQGNYEDPDYDYAMYLKHVYLNES